MYSFHFKIILEVSFRPGQILTRSREEVKQKERKHVSMLYYVYRMYRDLQCYLHIYIIQAIIACPKVLCSYYVQEVLSIYYTSKRLLGYKVFMANHSTKWSRRQCQIATEFPKIYRKSVLHLLKYTANLYLSRCSTDLR